MVAYEVSMDSCPPMPWEVEQEFYVQCYGETPSPPSPVAMVSRFPGTTRYGSPSTTSASTVAEPGGETLARRTIPRVPQGSRPVARLLRWRTLWCPSPMVRRREGR